MKELVEIVILDINHNILIEEKQNRIIFYPEANNLFISYPSPACVYKQYENQQIILKFVDKNNTEKSYTGILTVEIEGVLEKKIDMINTTDKYIKVIFYGTTHWGNPIQRITTEPYTANIFLS